MVLQIKHLTPYLPYNLQIQIQDKVYSLSQIDTVGKYSVWVHTCSSDIELMFKHNCVAKGRNGIELGLKLEEIKPLLHPLENLLDDCPEEIRDEFSVWEWDTFTNRMEFRAVDPIDRIPTSAFLKMVELKYDVFRLIPQGLALDINTVLTK